MRAETPGLTAVASPSFLRQWIGAPGRVVASWTGGGAVFIGGFLAAGVGLIQQPSMVMAYASALFLGMVGAAAGFVHGSALAYLGRPPGMKTSAVLADIARGAIWSLPVLAFALILAPIIALGPAAVVTRQPLLIGAAAIAAMFGALTLAWAIAEGWRAARQATDRWPEHRWGLPLVFATLALLLILFETQRPAIWWTDIRVTYLGAVLLALGATLWLAIPVEYAGLHFLHRWQHPAK
jgi:hypothetical protein